MAGIFEITEAGEKSYFFKLTAPEGTVVAVSPLFNTIKGAAAGITAVRENAATGLIVDKSRSRRRPLQSGRLATG
ncbi:YegP family protein [Arthrobacter sp. RHLT1-20]